MNMIRDPMVTRRRAFGHAVLAVTFAFGMRTPFEPQGYEMLAFSVVLSVLVTQFCMIDSKLIGKPLPWSLQWLIYFTWPVFAPVYLLWTRGMRKLHIAALHIGLYLAAYYVPAYGMWLLLSRIGQE